eukprot:2244215-Pleurochrysis_carterae.AAC.2
MSLDVFALPLSCMAEQPESDRANRSSGSAQQRRARREKSVSEKSVVCPRTRKGVRRVRRTRLQSP